MIDINDFCSAYAVKIDDITFQKVYSRAKHKCDFIISRYGDGNGARRTDKYMLELMRDELCSLSAELVSEVIVRCLTA